ncbi:MAG: histidine ammonia-lyase [Maribacter sp.]|jgi:histidine ammonia-lyase
MKPNVHYISSEHLSISDVENIIQSKSHLCLSEESKNAIQKCRDYLDEKLAKNDQAYYGINTGFGSLCNVKISSEQIEELQHNLVRSHACGMGDEVPEKLIKLMLLLKIQSLSYGYSGVRVELVNRLIDFYNHDALPVIYEQGSLGASGDLAPLAHMSLSLLGEGKMYFNNKKVSAKKVFKKMDWTPMRLQSKEGLALLNGTQFSLGYALWCAMESDRLSKWSDLIAAMSIDAFDCRIGPFDDRIHQNRPHPWQIFTANRIRQLLDGSEIIQQEKINVQDPYAFRCVPQVHGASKSTIDYVRGIVEIELNSVTDNPNIFPDTDAIISGGNFHAQPLALASDFLAIALSELGSISERRVYQLIGGERGLPSFLTDGAGLHSGMMISQYTAASIVSQNKQLCTPASVDSIVSCNGQEDHVSMAANAGTKCYKVASNVGSLLGVELMAAAKAIEYRQPKKSSPLIEKLLIAYRKEVTSLEGDRILYKDMHKSKQFINRINPSEYLPSE